MRQIRPAVSLNASSMDFRLVLAILFLRNWTQTSPRQSFPSVPSKDLKSEMVSPLQPLPALQTMMLSLWMATQLKKPPIIPVERLVV